ncbi:WD40-repeat-containing domain protein [Sporodiniella umbellata]|nr:WD40-repeat-containing domain protein [Sporodiniella umbellata]
MIIIKPDWVSHADKTQEAKGKKPCVYSVHVHPDGTRLATGSLDTTIKIWNTKPIYSEEAERNPQCNKLLCTMTMHNGAVLCVRWSNGEGQYLASSSDSDNVIIIWERDDRLTSYFYIDVQDLAWSKDNQYLASCGVDGFVIVWDGKTFEQVKKIDRHEGFVKGITWDPAGKYLASQSDDKTVKIWRTADWGLETTVKDPFINAPGTTLFRRISIRCVAAVIGREDWNTDVSLVGHQLPIEITSFNPKMFNMKDDSGPSHQKRLSSICAIGSQDRSISIWITTFCKPICVVADIFDNYVYDIAWSPDGKSLFACSQDGTVACLQFQKELDDVASEQDVISKLEKYGYGKRQTQLIETLTQMELEEGTLKTNPPLPQRVADLMQGSTVSKPKETVEKALASSTIMRPTVTEQKVSVSKSGKRRIQPVSLSTVSSSVVSASTKSISATQHTEVKTINLIYADFYHCSPALWMHLQQI